MESQVSVAVIIGIFEGNAAIEGLSIFFCHPRIPHEKEIFLLGGGLLLNPFVLLTHLPVACSVMCKAKHTWS